MGMIGRVLAAVASAIRRVVWKVVNGVLVPVAETVDVMLLTGWNFAAGLFHRGQIETHEEIHDDVGDHLAQSKVEVALKAVPAHSSKPSLGLLAKRAAEMRDQGQSFAGIFDDRDPIHRHLRDWVGSLSETGLRTLRHMPPPTIGRHLDHRDGYNAGGGLPPFHPAPIELSVIRPDQSSQNNNRRRRPRVLPPGSGTTPADVVAAYRASRAAI